HIVNFSRDEVPEGRTDWDRLRTLTDDEVEQAAEGDPDNPPIPAHVLADAELVRPEDRAGVPVSLRLDPDLLDFFKAGGPGYQARINAALREHVNRALASRRRRAGG
ncbi:MAG TPA: BrnA antitoxin family protein, partial [Longimicrobium sp.]|nr:BrnA antitoxin family protein [Longimicrobium sp.]